MNFKDIIGQQDIINRLRNEVDAGRLPHALMLYGPSGSGKLALALALARYMLCQHPEDGEPCGHCHSCRMTEQWAHPDLHFTFPVFKISDSDKPVSDDHVMEWREQLARTPYFTPNDWLAAIKGVNQQLRIYVSESDALLHKLSLKSSQGGYRVVIIWLPEKMSEDTSNKLLKLIEEPPSRTHFLMVCQEPDQVLGTIVSRTQRIMVPPLSEEVLAQALISRHSLPEAQARDIARVAQGNYTQALQLMETDNERQEYFDLFVSIMRLCYMHKVKEMREWSEQVASKGRESQKRMLEYWQRMVRENFIYNFRRHELNYMSQAEQQFAQNFARFINERNVIPIMEELSDCQADIEQNVNPKMVFFDFGIKMTILLKQ